MPPKLKTSTIKQRYRLIAAVRTQPLLYEPNKTSAENIKTKDLLWIQIASQCGIKQAQVAKVMWRKMYDSYVAYKKNPQLNENSVYAMFFKQMKFIDPLIIIPRKEVSNNSADVNSEVPHVETIQNLNETREKAASNGEFTTFQYWNETEDDTTLQNKTQHETTRTCIPNKDVQQNKETDQMAKVTWRKMYESYLAHKKNPQLNETGRYAMFIKHMKSMDPSSITPRKEANDNSIDLTTQVPEVETISNLNETREKATSNGEFTTFQYWNETEDDTTLQNKTQNETTRTCIPNRDAHQNNETAQTAKVIRRKMYDSYVAHKKNPQLNETGGYAMFLKHMKSIDPSITPHKEVNDNSIDLTTEVPETETITNLNEIKEEAAINGEFTTFQYWNETEDDTTLQNKTQNETTSIPNGDAQPNNATDVEFNSDTEMDSYEDIILPDNGTVDNSLKMFFDAMYASTSQLPLALQRKVKQKVFSTIIEAEEEAENQKKGLESQLRNN